jgi:carbonic anhydrase
MARGNWPFLLGSRHSGANILKGLSMCTCGKIHRRGLLTGAGGLLGASLLSVPARSATVTALAVTCIDYRLVDDAVKFFAGQKLTHDYDLVALAGASLAAVSPKFPSSNAAFWDHVGIAKTLHNIRKVIVVDHRECGAYKVAFDKDYKGTGAPELAQHKEIMAQVKTRMAKTHPDLASEFYLMDIDGKTQRVI